MFNKCIVSRRMTRSALGVETLEDSHALPPAGTCPSPCLGLQPISRLCVPFIWRGGIDSWATSGGWRDPKRASWRRGDGGMELPGLTDRPVLWFECI